MLLRLLACGCLAGALLALSGCAGNVRPVPEAVRVAPPGNLQLAEVAPDPSRHLGRAVRWGGEVMGVRRDGAGNAIVEVLGRRLDNSGRPFPGGPSDGRFHVRAAPSVDPDLYQPGTALTVAGTVAGVSPAIDSDATVPLLEVRDFMSWGPVWYRDPYYWPAYGPYSYYPYYYGPRARWGIGYGVHRNPYWW